ncbi:MAG: hypothetical protein D6748_14435 [Calditrichaeota bacterium]|nr:MAG: hypothetical protein D6748_14435 [Calditrichota bacterium]
MSASKFQEALISQNDKSTQLGLNQAINVGPREFHIQTSTLVDEGLVRTEVFERGRLLFVEYFPYERRDIAHNLGVEERLKSIVDQFHQSIIEEIDSLFEVSERLMEEKQASAHEKIGLVFLYMHIFEKAEKHLLKALELEPGRFSSSIYLGKCYFFQKRYNKAYQILSKLLPRDVNYPDLYNLLGLIMLEKKNYGAAFKYFKQALKFNSSYIEVYFNLCETMLQRIIPLQKSGKNEEVEKSINFLNIILKKINNLGKVEERSQSAQISKLLSEKSFGKALHMVREFREKQYLNRTPPEVHGYKFYLRLFYNDEEMSSVVLEGYEEKIAEELHRNPSYPDLWHYLALIHLMQCRHYFLKGLDNFRDATRINPNFEKALKNLRLVENDGREFLAMIKTFV